MNDHPVTTDEGVALRAAVERGKGASNYWVQWWNYADNAWETMQLGTDRPGAARLFSKMSSNRVLLGADDAEHIIVCTSPAYEQWATPYGQTVRGEVSA